MLVTTTIPDYVSLFVVTLTIVYVIHILYLNKKYPYPGPFFAKLTPLWLYFHTYRGTEASTIRAQHLRYNSPIIRIAPRHLSISNQDNDPEKHNPVREIYVYKSGLRKPDFYGNFDVDGHQTIFSTPDPQRRALRAKAVLPLFALNRIGEGFEHDGGACHALVNRLIERLERWKSLAVESGKAQKLDILNECRRLATDVTTEYLCGQAYGALEEDGLLSGSKGQMIEPALNLRPETSTANAFVDSYVEVGPFFLLPPRIFKMITRSLEWIFPSAARDLSMARVHAYCKERVLNAEEGDDTYQSRLLFNAALSSEETIAQVKDIVFAGTDTSSTAQATLIFHLINRPELLSNLKDEFLQTPDGNRPLFDATIKEGLRLGFVNPPRLARIVPPNVPDFTLLGKPIPPGTILGCSSYCLHSDPHYFPDPFYFKPERWLEASNDKATINRMNACMMPFGAGIRQCIARNLATQEFVSTTEALIRSGVLEGMKTVSNRIQRLEWFNSRLSSEGRLDVWLPAGTEV